MPDQTLSQAVPSWWPLVPALRSRHPGIAAVRTAWLMVGLLSVLLAFLEAKLDWSGIPLHLAGFEVPVTIYPPLILTLLLALWLGPTWGGSFAWLATFTSALTQGVAAPLAALFALATPLELLIVWGCLTILGVPTDLRGRGNVLRFIGVALIAATASSLAALVYIDSQALDLVSGQRIWQGWIIGDVLQMAVAIPILRLFSGRVRSWVDRQFPDPPRHEVSYTRSVLLIVAVVLILVTLVAQGLSLPAVIRALGLAGDQGPNCEEVEARGIVLQAALSHLEDARAKDDDPTLNGVYDDLTQHYRDRLESLSPPDDGADESEKPRRKYEELNRELLQVERDVAVRLRNEGRISDEVLRQLEHEVDLREARVSGGLLD